MTAAAVGGAIAVGVTMPVPLRATGIRIDERGPKPRCTYANFVKSGLRFSKNAVNASFASGAPSMARNW